MIKEGDKLPAGKLWELAAEWEYTCVEFHTHRRAQ